jgi:membrane complex biogenesis BtpA family protein
MAVDALFVREIFTGVYASDFGLWNTNCGEVIRHQYALGAQHIKLLFNIVPEAAAYLGSRNVADIARSTVFNYLPDALCVSGLTAGSATDTSILKSVKTAVSDTPVFVNTGVNLSNINEQLSVADGAVTGTTFKKDGAFFNPVDQARVREFMDKVKAFRG